MRHMKAGAAAVLMVLLAALPIFAAGEGESAEAEQGPMEFRIVGGYQNWQPGVRIIVDEFMAENPNVEVEIVEVTDTLRSLYQLGIASDNLVDMGHIPYDMLAVLVESDLIVPLTDRPILENVSGFAKEAGTIDGEVYTASPGYTSYGLVYNTDIFEQVGIDTYPRTRDELASVIDTLNENGITPFAPMLGQSWANGQYLEYVHAQILHDNPGLADRIIEGDAAFTDEIFHESLDYLQLVRDNVPDDAFDYKMPDGGAYFGEGKAAMTVHGNWIAGPALAANPDLNFNIVPLPWSNEPERNKLIVNLGFGWGVLRNADNRERPERLETLFELWKRMYTVEGATAIRDNGAAAYGITITNLDQSGLHPIYLAADDFADEGKLAFMNEMWKLPNARIGAQDTFVQGYMSGQNDAERILEEIQLAIELALDE